MKILNYILFSTRTDHRALEDLRILTTKSWKNTLCLTSVYLRSLQTPLTRGRRPSWTRRFFSLFSSRRQLLHLEGARKLFLFTMNDLLLTPLLALLTLTFLLTVLRFLFTFIECFLVGLFEDFLRFILTFSVSELFMQTYPLSWLSMTSWM